MLPVRLSPGLDCNLNDKGLGHKGSLRSALARSHDAAPFSTRLASAMGGKRTLAFRLFHVRNRLPIIPLSWVEGSAVRPNGRVSLKTTEQQPQLFRTPFASLPIGFEEHAHRVEGLKGIERG